MRRKRICHNAFALPATEFTTLPICIPKYIYDLKQRHKINLVYLYYLSTNYVNSARVS